MRKRYFFHTITDKDEIFNVTMDVKEDDNGGKSIKKYSDNLKAIKIYGKPYVYHVSTDLKIGDNVMIIRPGSMIDVDGEFDGFFDFLPKCNTYDPEGQPETWRKMLGRRIMKRKFGNVMSHGLVIAEKELVGKEFNFQTVVSNLEKYISAETAEMIRRHIESAKDCLRSAKHLYEGNTDYDIAVI